MRLVAVRLRLVGVSLLTILEISSSLGERRGESKPSDFLFLDDKLVYDQVEE